MPLENAPEGSPGFSRNIKTEVEAGKPVKQAVAIAYSKARGDMADNRDDAAEQDNRVRDSADGGVDVDLYPDKLGAILDSAHSFYAAANSRADALHHRESYDRAQALEYQANAAKARKELEAMPGYASMSEGEKTKAYKALEEKYDGARRRAFASGRREALARQDGNGLDRDAPCPICGMTEGCDHPVSERQRADGTEAVTGMMNAHLDAEREPAIGSEAREEMPEDVFLQPGERKYPVKKKHNGAWVYNRELLISAAREARAHGHEDIANKADHLRKLRFGEESESRGDANKTFPTLEKARKEAERLTAETGKQHRAFGPHYGTGSYTVDLY